MLKYRQRGEGNVSGVKLCSRVLKTSLRGRREQDKPTEMLDETTSFTRAVSYITKGSTEVLAVRLNSPDYPDPITPIPFEVEEPQIPRGWMLLTAYSCNFSAPNSSQCLQATALFTRLQSTARSLCYLRSCYCLLRCLVQVYV